MKLTKKELEEVKEKTNKQIYERVQYRKKIITQYTNYIADIEALIRVYKMKNQTDKIIAKGYDRYELTEAEEKEILNNYPELKQLDSKYNWIIRDISYNYKKSYSSIFETKFYYTDSMQTLWNEAEVKTFIEALEMFGYTELRYGNSSTIATENIHYIITDSKFELRYSYIDDQENFGKPVLVFKHDLEQENIRIKELEKESK